MEGMRVLKRDPQRDDSRSDIFTKAAFESQTGGAPSSLTMRNAGSHIKPPPKTHEHHSKNAGRSKRVA